MAIAQEWRIEGLADCRDRMRRMKVRLRDTRPASANIGEEMIFRTQRRMAAGLDIHGRPFKRNGRSRSRAGVVLGGNDRSMANSVHYSVTSGGFDWFSTHVAAHAHQTGATIVPRVKKFLTIPLRAAEEESRGFLAITKNRRGDRARHFKNTFFLRRNGKLFLMQRDQGDRLRALFLLVKKVQLKKNEWLGFTKADDQMVVDTYAKHIDAFSEGGRER